MQIANVVRMLGGEAVKKLGLEINTKKTNTMELIKIGENSGEMKDLCYEKLVIISI